jgi:hypothetical protein
MAEAGHEPTGSMGKDSPLAVLSDQAPSLFRYFHQLFAQVTNPAIDPHREALVMSLATATGPDGNTLEETPDQCHRLTLPGPVLTNGQLARLAESGHEGMFLPRRLPALFDLDAGEGALESAVERLCQQAVEAVDEGCGLLILSDRGVDARRAPIPALLALSAVHQRLTRDGIRMQTGLLVETGEAREVHDFATLFGFGVAAVNPYVALDTVRALADSGEIALDETEAQTRYIKAIEEKLVADPQLRPVVERHRERVLAGLWGFEEPGPAGRERLADRRPQVDRVLLAGLGQGAGTEPRQVAANDPIVRLHGKEVEPVQESGEHLHLLAETRPAAARLGRRVDEGPVRFCRGERIVQVVEQPAAGDQGGNRDEEPVGLPEIRMNGQRQHGRFGIPGTFRA